MVRYLFIMFIIILIVPIVSSESFINRENTTLLQIEQCKGPIFITTTPQTPSSRVSDLIIHECTHLREYAWRCTCDGSFDVVLYHDRRSRTTFNIIVQHYLDYQEPSNILNMTSPEMLFNSANQRVNRFVGVSFENRIYTLPEINLEIKPINIFYFIMIVLIIGLLYFFFIFRGGGGEDDDYDSMNYRIKKESDVDDILRHI